MMHRTASLLAAFAFVVLLSTGIVGCSLGGIRPAGDLPEPTGVSQETTETSVFYSTGRSLVEERKVVGAEDVYGATLTELLRAVPEQNPDIAIVQPEATFDSVEVSEGVATVDWNADVLDFEAEPKEERLAFAAILATLGQFEDVQKVRFTVDGRADGEANGKEVEAFWGEVSLKGQPFKALKISRSNPASETPSPE